MSPIESRSDHVHGRGTNLLIISILFVVAAAFMVATRVASRWSIGHKLGPDDYVIFLSMFFSFTLTGCNCISVKHGAGKDQDTLTSHDLQAALRAFYAAQIVYKVTINLTKTSICLLYLRLFTRVVWFRRAVQVTMTFVVSYATASVIATIFECTPISRVWDRTIQGSCIDLTKFWYANAGFNIFGDCVIFLLPIQVVYKLQLPLRQRCGLLLVFGLGCFVCITSVLRMTTLDTSSKSKNLTSGILNSTIWTTVEANTGIICACLPMLKAPLTAFFPRLFPRGSYTGYAGYAGNTATAGIRRAAVPQSRSPVSDDSWELMEETKPSMAARISAHTTLDYPPPCKFSTNNSSNANIGMDVDDVPLGRIAKTTNVKVQYADNGGCSGYGPNGKSYMGSDPKPVSPGFSPP